VKSEGWILKKKHRLKAAQQVGEANFLCLFSYMYNNCICVFVLFNAQCHCWIFVSWV